MKNPINPRKKPGGLGFFSLKSQVFSNPGLQPFQRCILQSCLEHRHSGGTCPATGCSALAPAKAAAQNKCIDSFTKSIFSIGKGFGEQVGSLIQNQVLIQRNQIVLA